MNLILDVFSGFVHLIGFNRILPYDFTSSVEHVERLYKSLLTCSLSFSKQTLLLSEINHEICLNQYQGLFTTTLTMICEKQRPNSDPFRIFIYLYIFLFCLIIYISFITLYYYYFLNIFIYFYFLYSLFHKFHYLMEILFFRISL